MSSSLVDPFGLVGQVLDGQFRVERVVGEGGFSVVYRGHHLGLEEPIAIKCLKLPGALGSALVESFVRRFRDESRLHYRLSQGNLSICRSIASGTTLAPATSALVPYMVLEWLEGRSLAQDFDARRELGLTGRPLADVVHLLDSAAEALAYAHAQGVVHRDVNPGNLFLSQTRHGPVTKVLDFGVAKVVSDHVLEIGPRAQTIGHIRIFAPAYGAPEQFEPSLGQVSGAADVYSLAIIMLEALRDVPVREGEHLGEFAMKALNERPPTPRALGLGVTDEVEAVFARALARSPNERPRDAGEFWGGLKHALAVDLAAGRISHSPHSPHSPMTSPIATSIAQGPVSNRAGAARGNITLAHGDAPPPGTRSSANPPFNANLSATVRMSSVPSPRASAPAESPRPLDRTLALNALNSTLVMPAAQAREALGPRGTTPPPSPRAAGVVPPADLRHQGASRPPVRFGTDTIATPMEAFQALRSGETIGVPQRLLPTRSGANSRVWLFLAGALVVLAGLGVLVFVLVRAKSGGAAAVATGSAASSSGTGLVEVAPPPHEEPTAAPLEPSNEPTAIATAASAVHPSRTPFVATPVSGSSHRTSAPSAPPVAPALVAAPVAPHAEPPPTAPPALAAPPQAATFPADRARAALATVDGILASCRVAGGRSGAGHVTVTFANDGSVARAVVDEPPFAGTPEGDCVQSRFEHAKMAPYEGAPRAVPYTFHLPP